MQAGRELLAGWCKCRGMSHLALAGGLDSVGKALARGASTVGGVAGTARCAGAGEPNTDSNVTGLAGGVGGWEGAAGEGGTAAAAPA